MKSIHLTLDFHSGDPIYLQIVKQIRDLAASGELRPGDQLPTVRQLASEIRVNFNTVARAYRMLDDARVISTQQGRGTYILEPQEGGLEQKIKEATLEAKVRDALSGWLKEGYSPAEILEEVTKIIDNKDIELSNEENKEMRKK